LQLGTRVGVSWMGGVDDDCWFCHHGMENLCDKPTFTGYSVNGGYAEYVLARQTSPSRCPLAWMTHMLRRCCAPGSSAFAACELRGLKRASGSDCLVLAAPQV
jgi:D-arabinose 1-dehydrogenase-like Zn-dependent alcohol dehydrogenase